MRLKKNFCRLLVTAMALVIGPKSAFTEVFFKETQTRYDLGSGLRTKEEIWGSVKKRAPRHSGRTAIGVAQGKPRLKYKFERDDGLCTVTELHMQMHVNLLLPRWDGIYSAKPELKAYYRCIKKTVVVHEREHSRIWYETAKRADKKLKSVLRNVPCDRFRAIASKHFNQQIANGSERQRAFDTADYARRRYQRCHAITKNNMTEAVRYTKAHQEWEPPRGRTAPQWSRPAIERTPRPTAIRTNRNPRPVQQSEASDESTHTAVYAPTDDEAQLSPTVWITALLMCVLAAFGWFRIAKPYLAAEFEEDEKNGSWADNIEFPDAKRDSRSMQASGSPETKVTTTAPTFGKRGL